MILKNKRGNIHHVISLFYRCCKGTTFISHIYSVEMLRNVKEGRFADFDNIIVNFESNNSQ